MLKHVELDSTFSLQQQFADTADETTILINLFDVDPKDQEYFKAAWLTDAKFFAAQPGYISAQLHQGVEGSRMFMNYAVFENAAAFAATNDQPEFGPLRAVYPDSATAHCADSSRTFRRGPGTAGAVLPARLGPGRARRPLRAGLDRVLEMVRTSAAGYHKIFGLPFFRDLEANPEVGAGYQAVLAEHEEDLPAMEFDTARTRRRSPGWAPRCGRPVSTPARWSAGSAAATCGTASAPAVATGPTWRRTRPLTSQVTCALLGLPEADIADFRRWAEAGPGPSDPLSAYVRELVGRRRGQPGEDAISILLAAGSGSRGVHEGRVTNLVTGMLAFGRQTPAAVIGTGVRLLLTHPDQRHRLDADRGLLPGAVEELLRLARLPAATESGVHRYAYADVAIAGVTIGTGDLVVLDLTAANKDERVFPDPDRFDPTRSPNPHLTFGHGYYMCNFARLARAQIGTGLTTLLDRVPALRLVGPADGDPLVAW